MASYLLKRNAGPPALESTGRVRLPLPLGARPCRRVRFPRRRALRLGGQLGGQLGGLLRRAVGGYGDEGYDEYGNLNSEAEEYYNSGASELVTTVR